MPAGHAKTASFLIASEYHDWSNRSPKAQLGDGCMLTQSRSGCLIGSRWPDRMILTRIDCKGPACIVWSGFPTLIRRVPVESSYLFGEAPAATQR